MDLIVAAGHTKLQIITDFDRTVTANRRGGREVSTTYAIVEQSSLMSDDYRTQCRVLFEKYSM